MEKEEKKQEENEIENEEINIAEPMFIWILLLIAALAVEIIAAHTSLLPPTSSLTNGIVNAAHFILFMPGSVILPLIVGAAIGAEVGRKSRNMQIALKAGILNGIYASIIYVIAIMIIYEIIVYVLPDAIPTVLFLVSEWLVIPVVILIVLSLLFSALSHSRKVNL